jgi:hypothetical protein
MKGKIPPQFLALAKKRAQQGGQESAAGEKAEPAAMQKAEGKQGEVAESLRSAVKKNRASNLFKKGKR